MGDMVEEIFNNTKKLAITNELEITLSGGIEELKEKYTLIIRISK